MSTATPKYHVGQEFWYVPNSRHGSKANLEVSKVGRKWLYLGRCRGVDQIRANIDTLKVDRDYGGDGTLYRSKQEWCGEMNRRVALRELCSGLHRSAIPWDLTEAEIRQAAAILRIELPEPTEA